jgi:glycosyltransferase involved in cell wall biosynthesis
VSTLLFRKPSIIKLGSAGRYGDVRRAVNNTASGIRKIFFKHISKFVCLTREIELELFNELHIPKDRLVRISNGVDLNSFSPVSTDRKIEIRKNLGIDSSKNIVLFVGRLEIKKRVDFLLNAWPLVQQEKSVYAKLLIVGDGDLRCELETHRDHLQLNDSVIFYGKSEYIASLMQAADILVLPSISEGLANVFLEAMATALPIIATDNRGNAEILTNNVNSLLFSQEDHEELGRKILYLLKNHEVAKTMGLNARKTVEERFNIESTAKQYAHVYEELLEMNT